MEITKEKGGVGTWSMDSDIAHPTYWLIRIPYGEVIFLDYRGVLMRV